MQVNGKLTWNNCIDSLDNKLKPPMSSAYYNVTLKAALHKSNITVTLCIRMIPQHAQPTLRKILPNSKKYNDGQHASCLMIILSILVSPICLMPLVGLRQNVTDFIKYCMVAYTQLHMYPFKLHILHKLMNLALLGFCTIFIIKLLEFMATI